MSTAASRSKYYAASPWTSDVLVQHCSHYLYHVVAPATHLAYDTALRSYLHFCDIHGILHEPTSDTLSLYLSNCASFVRPGTLTAYLSGVCSHLEHVFPSIR